jgi:hypothetical protein
VLREIRAARAQEAQAQEDAPMVGMVAHVLGTLALVGAGIVFAALLDLDVTMGTPPRGSRRALSPSSADSWRPRIL